MFIINIIILLLYICYKRFNNIISVSVRHGRWGAVETHARRCTLCYSTGDDVLYTLYITIQYIDIYVFIHIYIYIYIYIYTCICVRACGLMARRRLQARRVEGSVVICSQSELLRCVSACAQHINLRPTAQTKISPCANPLRQ